MNTMAVSYNLALLVPLSCLLWWLVLPRAGSRAVPVVLWLVPLAICTVPLGGFLAAMVALSFGEHLALAPFSWVDRPLFAAKVILACGLVGGFFSYGVTQLALALARRNRLAPVARTAAQR